MCKLLKFLTRFSLVLGLMLLATHVTALASTLPGVDPTLFGQNQLPTPAEGQSGQEIAQSLVSAGLSYAKTATAVIGILIITILGIQLVIQGEEEEKVTNVKRGLTYSILAFVLISMAQDLGKIFDQSSGTIIGSPQEILSRVNLFDRQVELMITFIKYVIGAFATLMFVRAGITMVTQGANEDKVGEARKSLIYTSGALVMIFLGDIFINRVFYKVNKNVYSGVTGVHPQIDAKEGIEQIVGITNFIVSFVGPVAVLALVAGGVMYAMSGGSEDRMDQAKRLVTAAALGIILIYGAFALVSTVIAGRLTDLGA